MKKLFKLYPVIFLLILSTSIKTNAQIDMAIAPIGTVEESDIEKVKFYYTKTFDSLLLEERYLSIIILGDRMANDGNPQIAKLPIPYLIPAYYFNGNKISSRNLLNDTISKLDYSGLIELLTTSNIGFIKFFNEPGNREPIINLAIDDYRKNVKATDKASGEQIISFFINDQSIRKAKYAFKKEDQQAQDKLEKEFREQDSIQNAKVYAFYKKHNKYLSEEEVGKTVSWYQPIILSHYDNIKIRQTFFKDLLEKAVKEGRLEKTSYVHFILRTESFTDPDFFKNLEKRIEEVRKEFDLPDYLWNPF